MELALGLQVGFDGLGGSDFGGKKTMVMHSLQTHQSSERFSHPAQWLLLEFWVCEFQLSSVVRVPCSHISTQIKVEMHCSKNIPAGGDIAMLQFTLSWCMMRGNELHKETLSQQRLAMYFHPLILRGY